MRLPSEDVRQIHSFNDVSRGVRDEFERLQQPGSSNQNRLLRGGGKLNHQDRAMLRDAFCLTGTPSYTTQAGASDARTPARNSPGMLILLFARFLHHPTVFSL